MDPKLLEYMRIMSGQPQSDINPIEEGTMSGIQASRKSTGMDEAQAARARGMAFMTMGHHLGQTGHGNGIRGALSAFNAGALPAAQAYEGQRQQSEAENAYRMQQEQLQRMKQMEMAQRIYSSEVKAKQREEEQKELQKHRSSQLGETKEYHTQRLNLDERKLAQKTAEADPSLEKPGYLRIKGQGKEWIKLFERDERKASAAIPEAERGLRTLDKMKAIMTAHPKLGSSVGHLLVNNNETDLKTLIGRKLYEEFNPKELAALEKMRKLSSGLNLATIAGFSAKQATDMLKKMIDNASVNGKLTKEGFDSIDEDLRDYMNRSIDKAKMYQNALKTGYYPMHGTKEAEETATESPRSEMAPSTGQIVQMRTPDGRTWPIPADKVEAAKARGAVEIGQ